MTLETFRPRLGIHGVYSRRAAESGDDVVAVNLHGFNSRIKRTRFWQAPGFGVGKLSSARLFRLGDDASRSQFRNAADQLYGNGFVELEMNGPFAQFVAIELGSEFGEECPRCGE